METAILERALQITVFSAAIFLFVALFRRALGKWLSPRMRYAVWFLVILRLLVPFTFESGFRLIALPASARQTAAPVLSASPAPASAAPVSGAPALSGGGESAAPGNTVSPRPQAGAQAFRPRAALSLSQWLLLVWGAGTACVLAAHAAMTPRLNRRLRKLGRAPGRETLRLYACVRETLCVRAKLPLVLLPDITSPALTAQLRPRLLMPDALLAEGSEEERSFSLMHELMHYKRGDHLVCMLLVALRAVWWFNPVVWLLPRALRTDMESACDARVVSKMDKRQKLLYAKLLLELG